MKLADSIEGICNCMKIQLLIFLLFFVKAFFGQTSAKENTGSIFYKIPIEIVAHTDSSLFLLGKRTDSTGAKDFYISKHSVGNNSLKFDVCLNFSSLFDGKFNPDNFRYKCFQCNDKIVIFFDVIISEKKTLIGKWIDFSGKVSDAVVIDKIDMSDKNLINCSYNVDLTNKKDLLISIRRTYKSGYQRDKCILMNEVFLKLWEYELPKINCHKEVNIISEIDRNSNLIYFIADEDNIMNEYNINNNDTLINQKIGNLDYKLKVRKDSLNIIFVNPITLVTEQKKIYYPYFNFPIIKSISSSQIVLYGEVNIDDENNQLPSKKGIFFKRVDIKNNKILLDTLFLFNDKIQQHLTYILAGQVTNRPTNKDFDLISENIIEGKMFCVFEHYSIDIGCLELMASCFNIANNKLEWVHFLPRKVNYSPQYINCFTISYVNKNFCLSFFERKENYTITNEQYKFNKYKLVKQKDDSNYVTYYISEKGEIAKRITDMDSEEYIFPWLKYKETKKIFENREFLPLKFLYN